MSVEKLISSWKEQGLIDNDTAGKLLSDLQTRRSGVGLGTVLATIGGLLLGAAVILLVAANWEYIPRLGRVLLVFAIIWIAYIGGVWRRLSGDAIFSRALFIIGASAFGAGIALVGQMYHLSGDEKTVILWWAGGVFLSAFLLRESVLSAFAMFVAGFYLFSSAMDDWDLLVQDADLYIVPIIALTGALAAYFTHSRITAHLVVMLILIWFGMLYFQYFNPMILWILLVLGGALLLIDGFAHVALERLTRFSRALAAYGFLAALMAIILFRTRVLMIDDFEEQHMLFYSVIVLGLCIGALTLCGRNNSGLRWLVYLTFSLQVLYLAFATIGTIIGTSGFFLTSGILVLLLAVFVRRMEKRLSGEAQTIDEVQL